MKNLKILTCILSILAVSSCDIFCPIPPLTMKRENYRGTLKINGLYFSKKTDAAFFLYSNGVQSQSCINPNITVIPNRYECPKSIPSANDTGAWGIFVVKADSIIVERWGLKGDCDYVTVLYKGKVVNDSIIVIRDLNNRLSVNLDTYRFVSSKKPDSLNNFTK
jgi:hypothetical protein